MAMTLDQLDFATVTTAQARQLLGAARNRDRAASAKASASQSDADIDEAWSAYLVVENLTVFIITGERPA